MAEASEDSVLGNLAAKRQQIVEGRVLKLPVEGWQDPSIIVHYKPLSMKQVRSSMKKTERADKEGNAEGIVDANAGALVDACTKIVIGSNEYPQGFGTPEIAEALDCDQRAVEVCRAIYIDDGQISSAAAQLLHWSGYIKETIDADFSGE